MNWGAEINRQVANATERELEAARSTIAERQKRIGELEAELKTNKLALEMCSNECNRLHEAYSRQGDALTAERQRREEADGIIKRLTRIPSFLGPTALIDTAKNYLSRYPPESPPSSTEAENE